MHGWICDGRYSRRRRPTKGQGSILEGRRVSGRCCWGCIAGLMLGQGRSLPDWQLIRLAKEMCVGSWVDRVIQQVVIACSS